MDKNELKKRRERLGMTQAELAHEIGVLPNTVSRYETGSLHPPKHLHLVFEALETRQIEKLRQPIGETK